MDYLKAKKMNPDHYILIDVRNGKPDGKIEPGGIAAWKKLNFPTISLLEADKECGCKQQYEKKSCLQVE